MKAVVTGGTGFLGSYLVKRLLAQGKRVTVLCRRLPPSAGDKNLQYVLCGLNDGIGVARAFQGASEVYHLAAKVGAWGEWQDFFNTNVTGTENVVSAAQAAGVARLIYTSSPSVIFDGKAHRGLDENYPYPTKPLSFYSHTKMLAEKLVLAANGHAGLATVALRPHLIWGVGDRYLIPRVIEQARQNKLRRVGDGTNQVDIIHVENAAEAHTQAAEKLGLGSPCAGKAYFLNQGRPVVLWDFIDEILRRAGLPPVTKAISFEKARGIGAALELAHKALRLKSEPRMSRFLAYSLAKDHFYSSRAAEADFGYAPKITIEQGLHELFPPKG